MKRFNFVLIFLISIALSSCSVYQRTSLSAVRANEHHDKKIKVMVKPSNDSTRQKQQFLFKRYEFGADSLVGYHKFWKNQHKTKIAYNEIQSVRIKNTLLSDLGTIGLVLGGIGITLGVLAAVTLSQASTD